VPLRVDTAVMGEEGALTPPIPVDGNKGVTTFSEPLAAEKALARFVDLAGTGKANKDLSVVVSFGTASRSTPEGVTRLTLEAVEDDARDTDGARRPEEPPPPEEPILLELVLLAGVVDQEVGGGTLTALTLRIEPDFGVLVVVALATPNSSAPRPCLSR
jgi:hypothetical protein